MPGRFLYLLILVLVATSCGPPPAAPAPASSRTDSELDPLEVIEQHVAGAVARARESVVALEYTAADAPAGARRAASGVVIGDDGDVLSVRIDPPPPEGPPIVARDSAGHELRATWVAADQETGLTLLKIPPGKARPAVPAQRPPTPGQPILVIGNPFGLSHSVSRGSVAGLNRRLELAPRQLGGLIQVDASLHAGDSGALLVDLRGAWLGVIRSGLAAPPTLDGEEDRDRDRDPTHRPPRGHDLGFAIPAADALWVAGQLEAHGQVDRAYLGVIPHVQGMPGPGEPEPLSQGVALEKVLPDTPADRAGLKPGDRIVSVDGRSLSTTFDLDDRLARTAAGTDVALVYVRGEGPERMSQSLTIRTTSRPLTDATTAPGPARAKATVAEKDKEKEKGGSARPASMIDRLDQLERRLNELEAGKAPHDHGAGVARRP